MRTNALTVGRGTIFILWYILSTTLYGIVTVVLGIFSRRWARRMQGVWARHLLGVGGVRIRVFGAERLDPAGRYVYIANHQSALDIPALDVALPHFAAFIAKKELFAIPVFGWGIRTVGHIAIDRSNARKARLSITRAVESLRRENISLILFPEGTRSSDGRINDFKSGAFTLALEAGVPIVPVALHGLNRILPKRSRLIVPGEAHVRIGEPVDVPRGEQPDKRRLAERVRNEILAMMDS